MFCKQFFKLAIRKLKTILAGTCQVFVSDGTLVMQVVGGKQGDTNTRTSLNQDMKKTHLLSKYAINVAQENVY